MMTVALTFSRDPFVIFVTLVMPRDTVHDRGPDDDRSMDHLQHLTSIGGRSHDATKS